MISLSNYTNRIPYIRWDIKEEDVAQLQNKFHCTFKKHKQYFYIKKVYYSPFDILLALEEMDFACCKKGEEVTIKILKI